MSEETEDNPIAGYEQAIDEVVVEAGDFYELITTHMLEDINRTMVSRMTWMVFFYGYVVAAAKAKGAAEPHPTFVIFCACAEIMGFDEREATTIGNFCYVDAIKPESPWYAAVIAGRDAHDAWADGSETVPLELLADALAYVEHHMTPVLAREGKYAPHVARIFGGGLTRTDAQRALRSLLGRRRS